MSIGSHPRVWTPLLLLSWIATPVFAAEFEEAFERLESPWLQQGAAPERDEEPLETDRDSFTPATTTVATGRTLLESSYTFIDSRNNANTHSFPELLTRVGVTRRLELRLGWNYEVGSGSSVSNGDPGGEVDEPGSRQETQLVYGVKVAMTEQKLWQPRSAMIVQATTPTSGLETASDFQLGYVAGWTFLDDWRLDSSLRYVKTTAEGDHFNVWAPSIVLKVPVAERWNVHGEYFGHFTDGKAQNTNPQYFSPGIHYLITPNCEIGVRVGWGLNQSADDFFSNVGLGVQF